MEESKMNWFQTWKKSYGRKKHEKIQNKIVQSEKSLTRNEYKHEKDT